MTVDMDLMAGLRLEIGRMADSQNNLADAIRKRETARARIPFPSVMKSSAVCPTPTANFAINMGGPDAGFYWVIRRIIVGGLTWSTTAAGSGEIYISGLAGLQGVASSGPGSIAAIRSLTDMSDQAASLPLKAFYGSEEVVVQANESLSVVIVGGTAGQQYLANCGIQVVRLTTSLQAEMDI